MNISILGHAAFAIYNVNLDGAYRESSLPIGPMLLQLALNPAGMNISNVDDMDELAKKYRCNFYALGQYHYADGREYYAIERYLGCRKAPDSGNDVIYIQGQSDDDAPPHLVMWDMGYGGLEIAEPEIYESVLWASEAAMPDKAQFAQIADRCFLCLDADVLRRAGAMISRQISWERTVTELVEQLQINSDIAYLMQARYILLFFAEDGAVYINNTGDEPQIQLILTHGGCEGSLREQIQGDFDNLFTIAILNLVAITAQRKGGFNTLFEPQIISGIVQTAEGVMMAGFSFGDKEKGISLTINRENKDWPAFDVPLFHNAARNTFDVDSNWTIANNVADSTALFSVAANYVVKGAEVIDGLPQLSFGALTTIDRWEIEAYQDIRNLIISYAHSEESKPLSIAVFGAPGSGKSFGVTQIAQNIMPGRIEKLEFNVSQFTSAADLGNTFQKVRDAIVTGKLPLVFFDEFDSERDGTALGWIKSFLMPMQDGKFKDESGEHPLGRCILIFAGGTAPTFEDFVMCSPNFKGIKGPDFISRLRGTIDVLGPNPASSGDNNYILRRALLLRSICERKLDMKQDAPINAGIIRAMLLVPEYKHGARSMEAIFNMSRITNGVWEPSSLPSRAQLSLHVDADEFMRLMLHTESVLELTRS